MNELFMIPSIKQQFEDLDESGTISPDEITNQWYPYNDINHWTGNTWDTKIPDETCVGTIFINENLDNQLRNDCKIELNFDNENLFSDQIKDSSGNQNYGILIGDFALTKNTKEEPVVRDSVMDVPTIGTPDKAY